MFHRKRKGGHKLTASVLKGYKVGQTAWSTFTLYKVLVGKKILLDQDFKILNRTFKNGQVTRVQYIHVCKV